MLQLLTILRIKKLANVKTALGMIGLCSLTYVAPTIHLIHKSEERVLCSEIHSPNSASRSDFGPGITIFITLFLSVFLPSLTVTVLTSIWSCVTFKKYYTGGNDLLNRRMLSLPVIMPLTIIATTVLESIVALLLSNLLVTLSWATFYHTGVLLLVVILLYILQYIHKIILSFSSYLHSFISLSNHYIKSLLKQLRPSTNHVTPSS